jgi:hypothetical protein
MKMLLVCFLLVTASVSAQVPAPFVGLSTSQLDLTSDPSHTPWYVANPTPGQPGAYFGPAYGGTQTDSLFGVTYHRPPRPSDCPPSTGPCSTSTQGWNVVYSKLDPWSRDGTRWLVEDDTGWLFVYDSSTDPYTFKERIQVSAATNAFSVNGNDIATDNSDALWCKVSGCGNKLFYEGGSSGSATGRNALKLWDEASYTATVVHDFTSTIASLPGCTSLSQGREGNPSDDDRYWFFTCIDGSGAQYGVISYDMQTDTVLAVKPFTAGGLCGASACPTVTDPSHTPQANWTGVCGAAGGTPYMVMNSNFSASRPNALLPGFGTDVFDKNLNFLGYADIGNSHADCGLTTDGKMVYVTTPYGAFRYDSNAIAITDLAAVSTAIPSGNSWAGERVVGLPCIWNYSGATIGCPTDPSNVYRAQPYTISMRGSHGTQQGAMMFSMFESSSNMNGDSGGWGTNENIIIMLNYSTAYPTPGDGLANYPVGTFYRVGWTHAVHAQSQGGGDNGDYFAQADAICNWDCTKVAFTSTADIDNGGPGGVPNVPDSELPTGQPRHMALYINLPISAPTLTTITVTPNPGAVLVGGTLTETATCAYSSGPPATCSVTWADTNAHSSVNSTTGVVTGVSAGTDTITATISSIFGTATVTVSAPPPFYSLQSVQVKGKIN